jgi:hypothetical protein
LSVGAVKVLDFCVEYIGFVGFGRFVFVVPVLVFASTVCGSVGWYFLLIVSDFLENKFIKKCFLKFYF